MFDVFTIVMLGVPLVALALAYKLFAIVPAGKVLVTRNLQGQVRVLPAGFHCIPPIYEECVSVRLADGTEVAYIPTNQLRWDPDAWPCQTQDLQTVEVDCVIHYRIRDVRQLVASGADIRAALYDASRTNVLAAARMLKAEHISSEAIGNALAVSSAGMVETKRRLAEDHGLELLRYHVEKVVFPDSYVEAREDAARKRVDLASGDEEAAMLLARQQRDAESKARIMLQTAKTAAEVRAIELATARAEHTNALSALIALDYDKERALQHVEQLAEYAALGKVQKLKMTQQRRRSAVIESQ